MPFVAFSAADVLPTYIGLPMSARINSILLHRMGHDLRLGPHGGDKRIDGAVGPSRRNRAPKGRVPDAVTTCEAG